MFFFSWFSNLKLAAHLASIDLSSAETVFTIQTAQKSNKTMEQLTVDEFAEEIDRRKEQLLRKRQLIQESEAQMKRLRMIEELKDLDQELESETYHPSSSSSSNSATSATSVGSLPIAENAVAAVAVIVPTKPENGFF